MTPRHAVMDRSGSCDAATHQQQETLIVFFISSGNGSYGSRLQLVSYSRQ